MKNIHLLRRYVQEAIDLGNIQFSPHRIDGADTSEPNTPEEQSLYDELVGRIESGKHLTQATARTLLDLLDSKYGSKGSGFFHEAVRGNLYRGQNVDDEWLQRHVPEEVLRNLEFMSSSYKFFNRVKSKPVIDLKTPYQFTQMRGWTRDIKIASEFAAKYATEGDRYGSPEGWTSSSSSSPYKPNPSEISGFLRHFPPDSDAQYGRPAVILVVTPKDSGARFLDLSRNLYKTSKGKGFKNERECINLQPVTVTRAIVSLIKWNIGFEFGP